MDAAGKIEWTLCCIDDSSVRAHKAAAGAAAQRKDLPAHEPANHALGRSRAGFGTKLHLVTDGSGLPLAVKISAGQAIEALYAGPVLDAVRIAQPCGAPRRRPERVAADRAQPDRTPPQPPTSVRSRLLPPPECH